MNDREYKYGDAPVFMEGRTKADGRLRIFEQDDDGMVVLSIIAPFAHPRVIRVEPHALLAALREAGVL